MDLADAHIKALQYLMDENRSDSFNLGNGNGHSVREVIEAVKKVSKKDFKIVEAERREGDPPVLISSSGKAIEMLKWKPQYEGIETIIETAWKWHQKMLPL
jgi:UDP-glucose 4-epimerase